MNNTTATRVGDETSATYEATPNSICGLSAIEQDRLIARALDVLESRIRTYELRISKPGDCINYLRMKLSGRRSECFAVLWLDNRHRLIAYRELFQGTIDGASVHPREVVVDALAHNACAAVLAHNHPSGIAEPSAFDRQITKELQAALRLVGVRVIDHIIVGDGETVSMAVLGMV